MTHSDHRWALVLAAGDGTRLSSITRGPGGVIVPKQYCALPGPHSMLSNAIDRAAGVVSPERVVTVVARRHAAWWMKDLAGRPESSPVVLPRNCGTASGILVGLLHVLRRDPDAVILIIASDQHVEEEATLRPSLEVAMAEAATRSERAIVLGMTPTEAVSDYGWILPGRESDGPTAPVAAFVEKPSEVEAEALLASGASWNAFMMAVRGRTLLRLFSRTLPEIVHVLEPLSGGGWEEPWKPWIVEALHDVLPCRDFSRDVLQRAPDSLHLLRVAPCGWSDMGTPSRVWECLNRRASIAVLAATAGLPLTPAPDRALTATGPAGAAAPAKSPAVPTASDYLPTAAV